MLNWKKLFMQNVKQNTVALILDVWVGVLNVCGLDARLGIHYTVCFDRLVQLFLLKPIGSSLITKLSNLKHITWFFPIYVNLNYDCCEFFELSKQRFYTLIIRIFEGWYCVFKSLIKNIWNSNTKFTLKC